MTGHIPDTVVILRDQAQEFPLCQQLYSCQGQSLKVRNVKPKSGSKVGGRNVNRGSWEYQVRFTMGILWVQFSDTIPLPINTITVAAHR